MLWELQFNMPFNWFITHGLIRFIILILINLPFPRGSKTSQAKIKFICDMQLLHTAKVSNLESIMEELKKGDKFWFCGGMNIVHCSALGCVLYSECFKNT